MCTCNNDNNNDDDNNNNNNPPPQAIAACHGAGVRVVMITGDHIRTATSIARSIGILHPG